MNKMNKWTEQMKTQANTELISLYTFMNNSVKNHFIFIIFGEWHPLEIWHQNVINFPTSPVYCGCTILRSVKKSYFNNVIHMSPNIQVITE